ncbi:MAG TPA: hypothetical protein VIQ30_22805 [Pseudonocardia sp.]
MTTDTPPELSPRRRAEQLAAAGLLPPIPPDWPRQANPRLCHACNTRLDPVLVELGETLHPNCDPPRRVRRRR